MISPAWIIFIFIPIQLQNIYFNIVYEEPTKAEVARVHESPDVPLVSIPSQALSIGLRYHLPILEAVAAQDQPRALSDHSQNLGGRAQQANSQ